MGKRVVVAPDKFKGSLTAAEVAARLSAGLDRAGAGAEITGVPVADGGDGTVDAAVAAGYQRIGVTVSGPTGEPVAASFALRDGTAVIEAAQACGLVLLPPGGLAPLTAGTRGVGELILAAADQGATRIVLGVGGSATTDGGAGLVQALGARLTDARGAELPPGGAALTRLAALDQSGLRDLSGIEFLLASDVDNPLLGPSGAAAVYGPQKGATRPDVAVLEAGLARWADVAEAGAAGGAGAAGAVGTAEAASDGGGGAGDGGAAGGAGSGAARVRDAAGAGAAGGLGFAARLFLGARMRPGIEVLLELAGFGALVDGARLVITGEGALDAETLRGKAPVGVVRAVAARDPGIPVVAVAGRCDLTPAELRAAGLAQAYALTDIEPDIARCIANAGPLVELLGMRIAAEWLR